MSKKLFLVNVSTYLNVLCTQLVLLSIYLVIKFFSCVLFIYLFLILYFILCIIFTRLPFDLY